MGAQHISWAELVETVGEDAATTICTINGGASRYIPSDFRRGDLMALLGTCAAAALSARYGGSTLMFPNAVKKKPAAKARILQLLAAGWSARRIALETGTTESWVWTIKRQASRRQVQKTLPISSR
jgi:DNA-binding NarL/FixJ family response regulator